MKHTQIILLLAGLLGTSIASATCFDNTTNGNGTHYRQAGYGYNQGYYYLPQGVNRPIPSWNQGRPFPPPPGPFFTPYGYSVNYSAPMQSAPSPEQLYQHMLKQRAEAEAFFQKLEEHQKIMQTHYNMMIKKRAEAMKAQADEETPATPEAAATDDKTASTSEVAAQKETSATEKKAKITLPPGFTPDMNVAPVPADSPDSPPPPPPPANKEAGVTATVTTTSAGEETKTPVPVAPTTAAESSAETTTQSGITLPEGMAPSSTVAPVPADSPDMPPPPPPPTPPAQ